MSTEGQVKDLLDRVAALQGTVVRERLADELIKRPDLGDALVKQIADLLDAVVEEDNAKPPPPDKGLAQLVGVGPDAAQDLRETRLPHGVEPYDEAVASERIIAVADLYYIYQHEKVGVFRAIQKLQELFRAGSIQLSAGKGAYSLYQFDRREVLRYTKKDRISAYRKAFGFGAASVPPGSRPNANFGRLFSHFNHEVALFWRDKRISDVMRERAYDPSFGSIAVVRRAGLDLRNNLKFMSYGHLNVLRGRGHAAAGRGVPDPRRGRCERAVRRGHGVGRDREHPRAALQRDTRDVAAAADGGRGPGGAALARPAARAADPACAVRGAAAADRRVRGGMADQCAVPGPRAAPHRHRRTRAAARFGGEPAGPPHAAARSTAQRPTPSLDGHRRPLPRGPR
jgi:hypothetical protein